MSDKGLTIPPQDDEKSQNQKICAGQAIIDILRAWMPGTKKTPCDIGGITAVHYIKNRPWADIVLLGTASTGLRFKALADTGADYIVLPKPTDAQLRQLGLQLSGAYQQIRTAGGLAVVTFLRNMRVAVEEKEVIVDVMFHPNLMSPPLLGRQALLAAFDVAFCCEKWIRTLDADRQISLCQKLSRSDL